MKQQFGFPIKGNGSLISTSTILPPKGLVPTPVTTASALGYIRKVAFLPIM
jgi:hypothetical protein